MRECRAALEPFVDLVGHPWASGHWTQNAAVGSDDDIRGLAELAVWRLACQPCKAQELSPFGLNL
jgi:hypothetical protein